MKAHLLCLNLMLSPDWTGLPANSESALYHSHQSSNVIHANSDIGIPCRMPSISHWKMAGADGMPNVSQLYLYQLCGCWLFWIVLTSMQHYQSVDMHELSLAGKELSSSQWYKKVYYSWKFLGVHLSYSIDWSHLNFALTHHSWLLVQWEQPILQTPPGSMTPNLWKHFISDLWLLHDTHQGLYNCGLDCGSTGILVVRSSLNPVDHLDERWKGLATWHVVANYWICSNALYLHTPPQPQ